METLTIPASPQEERAWLKQLSRKAQDLVQAGKYPRINLCLIDQYRKRTGAKDLLSATHWNQQGFRVKQDAHGYPIWGRQVTAKKSKQGKVTQYTFFTITHVFSEAQVEKRDSDDSSEFPNPAHQTHTRS